VRTTPVAPTMLFNPVACGRRIAMAIFLTTTAKNRSATIATIRRTGQPTLTAPDGELNRKSPPMMRAIVPNTPKSPWLVILTSAT